MISDECHTNISSVPKTEFYISALLKLNIARTKRFEIMVVQHEKCVFPD